MNSSSDRGHCHPVGNDGPNNGEHIRGLSWVIRREGVRITNLPRDVGPMNGVSFLVWDEQGGKRVLIN